MKFFIQYGINLHLAESVDLVFKTHFGPVNNWARMWITATTPLAYFSYIPTFLPSPGRGNNPRALKTIHLFPDRCFQGDTTLSYSITRILTLADSTPAGCPAIDTCKSKNMKNIGSYFQLRHGKVRKSYLDSCALLKKTLRNHTCWHPNFYPNTCWEL